jgi:precorrin-6B methylase 2
MKSIPDIIRCVPLAKRLGARLRRLRTFCLERSYRIDTTTLPVDERDRSAFPQDCFRYDTIDYGLVRLVLDRLQLGADDVAYEIGCGLGRIVCMLARRPIRKCVGIEISPALAEGARRNIQSLRGRRCETEIRLQDAAEADYSDGTVFLLFNPFGERILTAVLERIHQSLQANPRPIRIAYIIPRRDRLLEAAPWLRCTGRCEYDWYGIEVSYWANTPETSLRLAA